MAQLNTRLIFLQNFLSIRFLNKLHFDITKLHNFKKNMLLLVNFLQEANLNDIAILKKVF